MALTVFGTSAWLDDVLSALVNRVADGAKLPPDKVFEYLGEPDDLLGNPPAEKFVSVSPLSMPSDLRMTAGAGAAHTAFDAVFRLDVFGRLATDQQLRDTQVLRNASRGMAQLVKDVVKSVHLWDGIVSPATTSIFREPARLAPQGITWNPRKPKTGWAWARVHVSVKFRTDLT